MHWRDNLSVFVLEKQPKTVVVKTSTLDHVRCHFLSDTRPGRTGPEAKIFQSDLSCESGEFSQLQQLHVFAGFTLTQQFGE